MRRFPGDTHPSMRDSKVWISGLILVVLGLHALPVVSYQGHRQTRWPFLAWAMYARSFPPGPIETMDRSLTGTTASGTEEEVTAWLVGLSRPAFRNAYMNPLFEGDSTVARELLGRINRNREDRFVEIRTSGKRYRLTDDGILTEDLPVHTFRASAPLPGEGI
jgi:hypothetical protein